MHYPDEIRIGQFTTSRREIHHLIKVWIAITIIFTIVLSGSMPTNDAIIISVISVGLGVILHEIGHKLTAQHYGCYAVFKSFTGFLIFGIVLSFFSIIFLAPGAVIISGPVGRRRSGIISASGPAVNMIVALAFFGITFLNQPLLVEIGKYGFLINSWLALFNLLPLGPLDGNKVLHWNKIVFCAMFLISILLVVFSRKLIYGGL